MTLRRIVLVVAMVAGLLVIAGPAGTASANTTPCTGRPAQASGTRTVNTTHAGKARNYLIYVPPGYDPTERTPVVFNFHGANSSAQAQMAYSEYQAKANEEGFLVVAPNALASLHAWAPWSTDVDDIGFVRDILDDLLPAFCVDTDHVHATGISSGGVMSSFLACRLANRFASVTTVAGTLQPANCAPSRHVPVLAFHGDADPLIPYEGGRGINGITFPPVRDEVREWALRNGCDNSSSTTRLTSDAVMRQWSCAPEETAKLVRINGGGHTWPGATIEVNRLGRTTHTISATDRGWSFFANHPRA